VARVNILRQIKTDTGWQNKPLERDDKGRFRWPSNTRFLIEWRDNGRRLRQAAGTTASEALEAQKKKRLELEAKDTGLKVTDPEEEAKLPLDSTIQSFLKDVKTFRKLYTWKKYTHVLQIFSEHVAPKSDCREITAEDIKGFLAWRKGKGFDPGTTLYTDRVILHNFFNRLKIDNPVKEVPRLTKFRKRPSAYTDADLKKFFSVCDKWERAFFSVALATGLRRGELQTLHWSDLDLARRRVHVTAKPEYAFLPKDWEERTVPLTKEVVRILKKHERKENCPVVFYSPQNGGSIASPSYLHDLCKNVAKRAGLNEAEWHLHRFRDTAATRWLRAGIDVRTVQQWLGHESLATTQKYLEPSKETEKQLEKMRLPF
jgi:integrase/recombinase XerD